MPRLFRALTAFALVTAAAVGSCTANLDETCVDGPCTIGNGGWAGYTSSAVSSGSPMMTSDAGDAGMSALACPTTPQTGEIPCDVFAVIHSVCNKCHTNPQQGGAPFQILTYADTQMPFANLRGTSCMKDSDCGPSAGSCGTNHICSGLRFQQMWISIGPEGCPQMPFGEGMLPEPAYSTLRDWLGMCAPPAAPDAGCGCPGNGCN